MLPEIAFRWFQSAARVSPKTMLRGCLALVGLPVMGALLGCYTNYNGTYFVGPGQQQNNALWVANGTNVLEFLPSQLQNGSSAPVPHLVLNSAAFGAPQGVTFDQNGNLWVIDGGTVAAGGKVAPALFEFTPTQLAKLATVNNPTPAVTIESSSFKFPQQAAFDFSGNLWVTDNGSNAIYVFTVAQQAATSMSATPAVTVTSAPAFNGPLGIAFDFSGNLYVANNATTTIFGFKARTLPVVSKASSGTSNLVPSVTLSDDGAGSIQGPWGLAFDSYGDLWSTNANAPNTVVGYSPAQLAMGGALTPSLTFTSVAVSGNQTLVAPNGIAFDMYGDVVVDSSAAPFGMAGYGPEQQVMSTTSGPVPDVFLVGSATTLNAPAGITFGPSF